MNLLKGLYMVQAKKMATDCLMFLPIQLKIQLKPKTQFSMFRETMRSHLLTKLGLRKRAPFQRTLERILFQWEELSEKRER